MLPKLQVMTAHACRLTVLKKRKVEDNNDFILGPVSPKDYKDTVAELNGSCTNQVFEFFKVVASERIGFAKHREAAERKAVGLAAADADAGETATSPRAAPTKKTSRKAAFVAAATAATEVKARRSVVADRRTRPRPPRQPGSWTSRPASSEL
jgi:hypothetical protein